MSRVAVIGASGFLGTAVIERLAPRMPVIPIIRGSGRAARLARLGIGMRRVDARDFGALCETLEGCTDVVNCTMSNATGLVESTRTVVAACQKLQVRRLVHISSVAVYGEPPSPLSATEDGPELAARGTYGWAKLCQDRIVLKAARGGLPCTILCPPLISGCYSYQVLNLLRQLRLGRVPLVDGGSSICNFVDVENLAYAVELAVTDRDAHAQRLFITDDSHFTWRDLIESLRALAPQANVSQISRDEAAAYLQRNRAPSRSMKQTLKHIVSPHVRTVLREDPLLASLESRISRVKRTLSRRSRMPDLDAARCPQNALPADWDVATLQRQSRDVVHSCAGAKELLGYRPLRDTRESMQQFVDWYRATFGWTDPLGDLCRELDLACVE